MSLVIGYTDGKNAIIMSDGRAGGTYAPSENYDKTIKINENIIMGFAGNAAFIKPLLNFMIEQFGEEIKNCTIDDIQYFFEFQFTEQLISKKPASSFAIIAKNSEGEIDTALFGDVTNYKFEKIKANSPRYLSIGGCNSKVPIIVKKNMENLKLDPIERMSKSIVDCSKIDNSINTTFFFQRI